MGSERFADALRVWRGHERSRRAGVPIVSVWIGEADDFESELGRTVVWSHAASLDAVALDCWREIAARRDLLAHAFARVAGVGAESPSEVQASWSARSAHERRLWLTQRDTPETAGAVELLRAALDGAFPREDAAGLQRLLAWLPHPECLGLTDPNALPAILPFVVEAPHVAVLACLEPDAWARLLPRLDGRSRALLEQGVISRRIERAAPPTETQQRMEEALEAARSARSRGAEEAVEIDSRARSLAEERLFELLEEDPVTHGLFQLNAQLPFTFGNARIEVDFVCTELRIAVEVDGYFHFQGPDAYRRDRRKDVLLQHQGYLVSRHLAEDVERHAGKVLHAIRTLVERRRRARRKKETAE